ncbi:21250_t:CDS:2 [Gigaspora margarita]|uniref:21250_t:CDS:1 n=1 Tax=Gigaspora margarita TaxID=4874 RepID=A0ABM8W1M3_GIGMA|nr:21250_t:CDS:2 [Gigaspora margarita]
MSNDFYLVSTQQGQEVVLQKWWHANGPEIARQLVYYYNYIPELASLFLDSYYLCASHYMQILSTNQFYERLVDSSQLENQQKLELIMDLNNQISWMQQYIMHQKMKKKNLKANYRELNLDDEKYKYDEFLI